MEAERWHRVSALFDAALALPPAEREAFLARESDDPEIAREVISLLDAEGRPAGALDPLRLALDSAAARLGGGSGEAEPEAPGGPRARGADRWSGTRLGAYVLEEKIGEGGMGQVYRAHRADRAYQSRVAVKLVGTGFLSDERVRRFHRERQILASLDHPSIARLLDGGTAPDGRPYLVMEHVEGLPIDVFCDRRGLGVDERLRLFRQVCSAVQTAHQSLVVHRDLKPANVLVTESGVPKLLDFGIAKLLEGTDLPGSSQATVTGLRPMTLHYASPEQLRGERITTATDVYALGVMLYELLVGRLPYRAGDSASGAGAPAVVPFADAILHEEPGRPSARVTADAARSRGATPRQLRRRLAGDLDTVVLAALAKVPERRYGAAEQLGADLDRHLAGLPVAARPASFGYRLSKLVRRKPLVSAFVALALVTILAFSVAMAQLAGRLANERDRARQLQLQAESERDRAQRAGLESENVADFLTELFAVSDPARSRGEAVTAREMLDRGVEKIGSELDDQPLVRASLLSSMGQAYMGLGLYDSAEPLLEEALALRRRELGEERPETLRSLHQLAEARRANGDFPAAESLYRESLARVERVYGASSGEAAADLDALAFIARMRADYAEAEGFLERSLAIREQAEGRDADRVRADTLLQLSELLAEQRKLARAEATLREAIGLKAELLGQDHPDVLQARAELGNVVRYRGRPEEVEEMLRETLAAQRRVLGAEHPSIPYTLTSLGIALLEQGRPAEGEAFLAEALDQRVRLLGPDHAASGVSYHNLAYARERLGRYREAQQLYTRAREVIAAGFSEDSPLLGHPLGGLGRVRLALGEPEEAEALLRRALELHRRRAPEGDPLVARVEGALGECLAALGRDAEAEELLLRSWRAVSGGAEETPLYRREARERVERFYRERGRGDRLRELELEE